MKKLSRKIINRLMGLVIGKSRYQGFFEKLHSVSLLGMNIGGGSDVDNSGEIKLIKLLSDTFLGRTFIFFDVGSNTGKYSQVFIDKMSKKSPIIHCFEPLKDTFNKLKTNLKNHNIYFHNLALGDSNKKAELYSDKTRTGLSSLYKRKLDHFDIRLDQSEEVEVRTLDSFCEEMGVKYISFLKIDAEGHELSILKGAKEMIDRNSIDIIQFEFGGCNIDSRTFFQDFYYLLSPKYKIYRIVKDGLFLVRRYDEKKEVFLNTNYVAVRNSVSLYKMV